MPEEVVDEVMGEVEVATSAADEALVGQLMDMGFGRNGCLRAIAATGGGDAAAATTWIFEHSCNENFNDPVPISSSNSASSGPEEAAVASLMESLGMFMAEQVRAALVISGGADWAADWLFSNMDDLDGAVAAAAPVAAPAAVPQSVSTADDRVGKYKLVGLVSQIGNNTSSGHYVCHLLRSLPEGGAERWVIYNDEKVAVSEKPPVLHAYVYLFRRADVVV